MEVGEGTGTGELAKALLPARGVSPLGLGVSLGRIVTE